MTTVVRQSKFRHVFGTTAKREQCYENINAVTSAADVNHIQGNSKYFAVPLLCGHSAEIIDFAFSPYNDDLVATGSADTTIKIWQIPEGGLKENCDKPLIDLTGHSRKISTLSFHPSADNVLASSAWDQCVKIWDLSQGVEKSSITTGTDTILTVDWSFDGATMATSNKDKTMRLIDPRAGTEVGSCQPHAGTKGWRAMYLGKTGKILTTGFSKISERQMIIWDPRSLDKPLSSVEVDTASGALMPFYDEDTGILFIGGKGDANIRYYEMIEEPPFQYFLSEFRDKNPHKGLAMLPKRACDVMQTEVAKFLRLTNNMVEPVVFTVPRKGEHFQEDLFPDSRSTEPSMTSDEYFGGASRPPKYDTMKPGQAAVRQQVKRQSPAEAIAARIAELELENKALKARVAELEGK